MRFMTVSVLICTYNRPTLLRSVLASILVDAVEKPDQLVLVNGGSDEANRVVDEFLPAADTEFRVMRTQNINLATSRNIGLKECRCDIVAMTDDDAEVFPDWITRIKELHTELPDAGAIGGMVYGRNVDSFAGRIADLITFPSWSGRSSVRTLPGVNISYKRSVLLSIGYQDETLFRGEDVDYNWRVLQLGKAVIFDPQLKVWHYHRPSIRGILHQQYMYGRAYYLVRAKWPEMYCIYPHSIRRGRDILKWINVFAAMIYQPFLSVRKLDSALDRSLAIPVLMFAGVSWRSGMLRQYSLERWRRFGKKNGSSR